MEGKREALIRHALNPIGTQVHESQTSAVTLQAAPGVDVRRAMRHEIPK